MAGLLLHFSTDVLVIVPSVISGHEENVKSSQAEAVMDVDRGDIHMGQIGSLMENHAGFRLPDDMGSMSYQTAKAGTNRRPLCCPPSCIQVINLKTKK